MAIKGRREIPIALPATGEEEWRAVREPLMRGWLAQGPEVAAFERTFADRLGVTHAVASTSCTTALHLILAAMDVGPGDEVIVPAFTWVATANVVLYCGARPVFVDVSPETFNLIPEQVAARITARTKAIIAVHLFGLCADMDAIREAAPGIPLIEDAACAAGARYKGRPAGSLGLAAAFSFHPRKAITTGEGGMVTTDDDRLAERVKVLRNHGIAAPEERWPAGKGPAPLSDIDVLGFNYRMTDVQAAIGLVQLRRLDGFVEERQKWAAFYERELASVPWLRTPKVPEGYAHCWQSYVLRVDEARAPLRRDRIMEALQEKGISTRSGTHAVHMLGVYRKKLGLGPDDYPGARDCERSSLAIPLHNRMDDGDFEYVVEGIKSLGR